MNINRVKGFTVIELVVVMVIVGIMAAVASPLFQNLPQTRAQVAITKLRSDVRYAQLLAIQSSVRTRVVFNSAGNSYQLERDNGAGTFIPVINPATRENYSVTLNAGDYAGVTFSAVQLAPAGGGNQAIVLFDSFGAPFYLNLSGVLTSLVEPANVDLNSAYRLRFRALTGKVDIVNL